MMASSIANGKVGDEHYEHASSVSNEKRTQATLPSSRKKVFAAWFRSMILCTSISPDRHFFHERPCHKRFEREPSNHVNVDKRLYAINLYNSSQVSITKLSTKDSQSPTGAPNEHPFDGVDIEELIGKSSPSPEIYEAMPQDKSIRLLRLHKGIVPDPVEFTLEFAQLDHTTPDYEAISYVWGEPEPTAYIKHRASQKAIKVTRRLQGALEHIRWCDRDRLIWVDALCINQEDGKEKGTQVRKMNLIFARASCVLVWLGWEIGWSNEAFGVLCALANETLQGRPRSDDAPLEIAQHTAIPLKGEALPPVVFDAVPPISDRDLWERVMHFFTAPWFTRLWVLQEIVLAQDATIISGHYCISWKYVGAAIEAIRKDQRTYSVHWLLNTRNFQNASFMWHLSTVQRNSKCLSDSSQQSSQNGVFPLLHLLDLARSLEVTDPRDKVYGLLGFPTIEGGFSASAIKPDYTLSTAEVYAQVTRSFIEKDQTLDILGFIVHSPQRHSRDQGQPIDNLPSWAPNFTAHTVFPISNYNVGHQYSAGFSRPVCLLSSPTPATLRLKGVILDTIRVTGLGSKFDQNLDDSLLKSILRWCIEAGVFLPTIAATLTAGRTQEGRLLSPVQKENLAADMVQLLNQYEWFRELLAAFPAATTTVWKMDAFEAKEALWRFLTYRMPFITDSGKFALGPGYSKGRSGLVQPDEKEPDVVVVLWGGQCPFVVGKAAEEGKWILKGECFVEEWMDGEAVEKMVREDGKEEVVFEFV